jgi:hypothetical protein
MSLTGTALAGPAGAVPVHHVVKAVAFRGTYKGNADLLIDNGSVSIRSIAGTGSNSLLGVGRVAGKGSASASAQCDPFTGTGNITGAHGTLHLVVTQSKSTGCSSGESGPITVKFHGTAVVKGGTGKAKGAKGTLAFSGKLGLGGTSGAQAGPYTVTITGHLSL